MKTPEHKNNEQQRSSHRQVKKKTKTKVDSCSVSKTLLSLISDPSFTNQHNMKTSQQKNDDSSDSTMTTAADQSVTKKKTTTNVVSFPTETLEDILSRLPVRSILRCRSVSKTLLNLLSGSPFNKLHFTRATTTHRRNGLFFSACYRSTRKRHYLTAANDGGPLTLLMTVNDDASFDITGPSHLNGVMCFTTRPMTSTHAFVVNPATRKVFKLPDMNSPSDEYTLLGYLYGFDESRNEHKILLIKKVFKTKAREFMIFSMSSYSWRTIDAEPPVGFDWDHLSCLTGGGVCVNSVVHLLLVKMPYDILAFDFVTEKFSVINLPFVIFPANTDFRYYNPYITKIDGCLGVVLHDRERSEVRIWLLQDYDKCLWVKETIKLSYYLNKFADGIPLSIDANMDDEIVFCLAKVTKNGISIPVYNMKTKCFKYVQFTLHDQLALPKTVRFFHISCYVETNMPLVDNWSKPSHGKVIKCTAVTSSFY